MKSFIFSLFASFFLTISMQLSAGSSSDNTQSLLETVQKRKQILSKGNSSKRLRVNNKHVKFQDGTIFPQSEVSTSFTKEGFPQEAIDSVLKYNEKTGEYTPLMLKSGPDLIEIVPLTASRLEKEKLRDLQFEFASVLPDSEWEYAFSIVERAFGVSNDIAERHPLWNHENRYTREVLMVMNALRFHFDILNPEPREIFIEHLNELQTSLESELNESLYYAFWASHTIFEESLDSPRERTTEFPEEERQIEHLIKKFQLIDNDLQKLRNAAQKASPIMKKIIGLGVFGNEEKRSSLLNAISLIYKNINNPELVLAKTTEVELRHIRRFIIALKQSLFRFINLEDQQFANSYDVEEPIICSK